MKEMKDDIVQDNGRSVLKEILRVASTMWKMDKICDELHDVKNFWKKYDQEFLESGTNRPCDRRVRVGTFQVHKEINMKFSFCEEFNDVVR